MPREDLPRIGVFCTSAAEDELDFALRSIELNTEYPDFVFLVGTDPMRDGRDPRPRLEAMRERYPWFDYVFYADRAPERLGLNSASDMLADLYARLVDRGCTRFFHVNDDISVGRYWLHYAESAMRGLDGCGVVIPHDGIASTGPEAGFCGFYYFSLEYVRRHCPGGLAYRAEPVQCYWVDTHFCLRARRLGRLVREPRCAVMHLHWSSLPQTLGVEAHPRRPSERPVIDGRLFIERVRAEGIDPWKHIPDLGRVTPGPILEEMKSLRGIEDGAGVTEEAGRACA